MSAVTDALRRLRADPADDDLPDDVDVDVEDFDPDDHECDCDWPGGCPYASGEYD